MLVFYCKRANRFTDTKTVYMYNVGCITQVQLDRLETRELQDSPVLPDGLVSLVLLVLVVYREPLGDKDPQDQDLEGLPDRLDHPDIEDMSAYWGILVQQVSSAHVP